VESLPGAMVTPIRCTLAELDQAFACATCGAKVGKACRGLPTGQTHIGRRVRAFLDTMSARHAKRIIIVKHHRPVT
jgi:hypothetical protein